jgi:hypothetical protein
VRQALRAVDYAEVSLHPLPTHTPLTPTKAKPQRSRPIKTPIRDDSPPPPPPPPFPSLAGIIDDFPTPKTFEEFIAMNLILGSLCGWILRKIIAYFRRRKASQRLKLAPPPSPPKRAPIATPRKSGDRSRPTPSRSRLPELRPRPFPVGLARSKSDFPFFLFFTLAGSGSFLLRRFKARRRAAKLKSTTILPLSNRHQTRAVSPRQAPAMHRNIPNDRVRLSRIDQVKYFYKDEIIGFENGPPPRSRQSSPSLP